jgi:hypothetical protein
MYSGENELAASIASVVNQKNTEIEQYFVINKRELDAHRDLYARWNTIKSSFDCFVQVDADVIVDPGIFEKALELLRKKKIDGHTSLQYPLHDFLTDTSIMGLNVYDLDVVFNVPNDEVFCDRATANNRTFPCIELAGTHASNPTLKQAFHFGLHRGLKKHTKDEISILAAYKKSGDDRRAMAAYGYKLSRDHKTDHSYGDIAFEDVYIQACKTFFEFKRTL